MPFDSIQKLRQTDPAGRPEILEAMYRKNLEFFQDKFPALFQFVQQEKCPYRLDITEQFVSVIDERTGTCAHPEAGLDAFAEMMGDWVHQAWVDLCCFTVPVSEQYPIHCNLISDFSKKLEQSFPEIGQRFASGCINLKEIDNNRRFSPPVVFLGIFHGLHIVHYLKRTELTSALFIEPDPKRFEVSCYFLDYEEIEKRLGKLYLSIGSETTTPTIESFFSLTRITPQMWVRVLTGYPFDQAPFFIEAIKGLHGTTANLFYPLDSELQGLRQGATNLGHNHQLLTGRSQVSEQCRIVVVATGPSLDTGLDWLKENRDKVILFAVHSSVRVLRHKGIIPDFQFNLDAVFQQAGLEALQLFSDVPLVTDYKIPSELIDFFEYPCLCADKYKHAVVHFSASLTETHPSTTNLAFSFACFCRPAEIYLLGCDFGYRTLSQDHAKHSMYEEEREKEHKSQTLASKSMQMLIEPNFSGTGPIQTAPVHIRTKVVMEKCIASNGQGISVFNLSDGALVTGARPQHIADAVLSEYPEKKDDVDRILKVFVPAEKGRNWTPFPIPGAERLRSLKADILDILTLPKFSWQEFSRILDSILTTVLIEHREDDRDLRMETYCRLLADLLQTWYRCLLFLDDIEEAEKVYRKGLALFTAALDELEWPEELDMDLQER